jgi:hypothetical protein
MSVRLTQLLVEAAAVSTNMARLTRVFVEQAQESTNRTRLTRVFVEIVTATASPRRPRAYLIA